MKSLFVTNLELKPNEGIYKKICAEAAAIGKAVGNCTLVMKKSTGSVMVNTENNTAENSSLDVFAAVCKFLDEHNINVLYIRLMVPNMKLIRMMKKARGKGTKVYYEIPTYPYYAEQFRASRKKYRAIAKIMIDAAFSPSIYRNCDHIVVIRSNSKLRLKPKMIEMDNGVRTDDIKAKSYDKGGDGVFRMVTVGTLFPYHGYDRILKGMKMRNEQVGNVPVEFHVIGASQTIDELHQQADALDLKRVFFHGVKTTAELNDMYESFDVGLGCLALHRRNADIDTTLKVVEYYCRGVPVVTSGKSPYKDEEMTIVVPDGEGPIDISDIYKKWKKIPTDKLNGLSENAKGQFSWDLIMKNLIGKSRVSRR